jgi:sugar O-acyltransferase (sialic acid O-acetyltransferase NeuD family)
MNKRLAILGAGGHGKTVADAALLSEEWSEVVFFDDAYPETVSNGRWNIIGTSNDLRNCYAQFSGVIVAIGNNRIRLVKTAELQQVGATLVSIIHPAAVISPFVSIAPGCVIFAGVVINVDAEIGCASIINTNSVIEHDCHISNGVHISPNATLAGQTVVGECSWIGIGAVTKQSISIGSDVQVGAGAVVVKSISDGVTVAGNPAVVLR